MSEFHTMRNRTNPEAVFDFDGTLVHLAENPLQNMLKYPMYSQSNVHAFIRGIEQTGTKIGPIISRRPRYGRTFVTNRAIADLGLSGWFGNDAGKILAGSISPTRFRKSEGLKAAAIIARADERVVGVVEDKPQKLGKELLTELTYAGRTLEPIVLGAVDCPDTTSRIDELVSYAQKLSGVEVEELHATDGNVMDGFEISRLREGAHFVMKVVALAPFSLESGKTFGIQLQHYAA